MKRTALIATEVHGMPEATTKMRDCGPHLTASNTQALKSEQGGGPAFAEEVSLHTGSIMLSPKTIP
jgi:hypothetical protein